MTPLYLIRFFSIKISLVSHYIAAVWFLMNSISKILLSSFPKVLYSFSRHFANASGQDVIRTYHFVDLQFIILTCESRGFTLISPRYLFYWRWIMGLCALFRLVADFLETFPSDWISVVIRNRVICVEPWDG